MDTDGNHVAKDAAAVDGNCFNHHHFGDFYLCLFQKNSVFGFQCHGGCALFCLRSYQEDNKSVWSRKLARASANIERAGNDRRVNRYVREYARRFKQWLKTRDDAYKEYIKLQK